MSRNPAVEGGAGQTTSVMIFLIIMIIVVTTTVGYSAVFAPETSAGSTSGSSTTVVGVGCSPTQITSVSRVIASANQTIVITGCGFG